MTIRNNPYYSLFLSKNLSALDEKNVRRAELDEYYYGARYYNPRESVWLSVDPLAELAPNMSPYRYAFNNPTNFVDPYGLFETRKDARQYRREHGIDGKIHKAKDGTFSIDDYRNSVSYSRSLETNEVEESILVVGNKKTNGKRTLNAIGLVNDIFDNLGGSLVNNSGKTRLGTNGKLYLETSKGGVFYGNQYVTTVPLLKYGKGITKVTGPIGHAINAGQIVYGMYQDNWTYGRNAQIATAGVAGGVAGGMVGSWAGAALGIKMGVSMTVWGGVVGAIAGGFIGGLSGGYIGSDLAEEIADKNL
jgi:RHS repeat-associated protein